MNKITIGKRLEIVRGEESQADFAARVGVHPDCWSSYERDALEISAEALRELAIAGWNPIWVLTGEGSERISPTAHPGAAVDTALILARDDAGAWQRRNGFIAGMTHAAGEEGPSGTPACPHGPA